MLATPGATAFSPAAPELWNVTYAMNRHLVPLT